MQVRVAKERAFREVAVRIGRVRALLQHPFQPLGSNGPDVAVLGERRRGAEKRKKGCAKEGGVVASIHLCTFHSIAAHDDAEGGISSGSAMCRHWASYV